MVMIYRMNGQTEGGAATICCPLGIINKKDSKAKHNHGQKSWQDQAVFRLRDSIKTILAHKNTPLK